MAFNLYIGGSDNNTDGTLEVPEDQIGLDLGAVGSTATFHMRCASGKQNAQEVIVFAPIDCHVSKNGIDYASFVVYDIGEILDVNKPCMIKRVASTVPANTWTGVLLSPRLSLITEQDVPEPPAAFTPTVSNLGPTTCRVTFSTTDPDGDTLTYKVAITESATSPADWTGYADRVSPYDATGLTALTQYYAHVRASDGSLTTVGTSAQFTTPEQDESPLIAGSLTATPGHKQASLSGPTATDNVGIAKWQYKINTGSWIDIQDSATGTMPTTTVGSLTNGTAYTFYVRAVDGSANVSGELSATATPATSILLDFESGNDEAALPSDHFASYFTPTWFKYDSLQAQDTMAGSMKASASTTCYAEFVQSGNLISDGAEYRGALYLPDNTHFRQILDNTPTFWIALQADGTIAILTDRTVTGYSTGAWTTIGTYVAGWLFWRIVFNFTTNTFTFSVRADLEAAWTPIKAAGAADYNIPMKPTTNVTKTGKLRFTCYNSDTIWFDDIQAENAGVQE